MNIDTLEDHRRYATTPSGPISYLDVGSGRPAVFIHGILANSLLWRHVIAAVAGDQRRCIAVDLPGHGHTPPAPANADVTLTGLARRVIELCENLGLDRFDLVGNDTGGAVAQIVAAQMGARLSTFTLTNCDTEGNTPPMLFKPVAIAARLGLLARLGPRVARSRRLKLSGLAAGCPHRVVSPQSWWMPTTTPSWGHTRILARVCTSGCGHIVDRSGRGTVRARRADGT